MDLTTKIFDIVIALLAGVVYVWCLFTIAIDFPDSWIVKGMIASGFLLTIVYAIMVILGKNIPMIVPFIPVLVVLGGAIIYIIGKFIYDNSPEFSKNSSDRRKRLHHQAQSKRNVNAAQKAFDFIKG